MKNQCPYCSEPIGIASRLKYCFISTHFSIRCPHCGKTIRPLKNPLSFQRCFYAGALTAFASFWAFIYLIKDHFWQAVLFATCISLLLTIAIAIVTIRNIEFTKDK